LIEELDIYGFRELETNDKVDASLLKFGVQDIFDTSGYDLLENNNVAKTCVSNLIDGTWTGHCVTSGHFAVDGLLELRLRQDTDDGTFHGDAEDERGTSAINGHIILDGRAEVDIIFSKDDGRENYNRNMWFFGKMDVASRSIRGKWGYNRQRPLGTFLLTRNPTWVHQFRYGNAEFQQNPARARWNFALNAIEYQLRKDNFSWSYIKTRIVQRKRVVELSKCRALYPFPYSPQQPFDEEAYVELNGLEKNLSRGDRRLYKSITKLEMRKTRVHP